MRFGMGGYALEQVQTHGGAVVGRDLLADALLAEELGFDSLWVAENHFSVDRQCSSPFVIAGVLAGATRRIRIGVFSILTFAHPLRVAEDAATLDLMSGGRLMLCFGTGYRAEEFAAFGIAMQGKGARFRECLEVVQKAWAGPFVHHGKHFRIPTAVEDASPVDGRRYRPATTPANDHAGLDGGLRHCQRETGRTLGISAAAGRAGIDPRIAGKIPALSRHLACRRAHGTARGDATDARGVRCATGPYGTSGGRSRTHADIRPLSTLGIADQRRERLRNLGQGSFYHRRPCPGRRRDSALSRALRHYLSDLPHGHTCRSA